MTTSAEFLADRKNFLRLLTDRDETGPIPIAIRVDLTPEQAALMAPGVEDFDELRLACSRFVENFLAPQMARLDAHLTWKARQ